MSKKFKNKSWNRLELERLISMTLQQKNNHQCLLDVKAKTMTPGKNQVI